MLRVLLGWLAVTSWLLVLWRLGAWVSAGAGDAGAGALAAQLSAAAGWTVAVLGRNDDYPLVTPDVLCSCSGAADCRASGEPAHRCRVKRRRAFARVETQPQQRGSDA